MNTLVLAQAAVPASPVGELHRQTGWYVAGLMGAVGLWGLALAVFRRTPGRVFAIAFGVAVTGMLAQVAMGVWAFSQDGINPGNQHVFYGVVIVFSLTFAYIYRAQLAKRPALSYGLLGLFIMGLGLRAIANFGQSFGP
jgi:hypothetical protein